MVCKECGIEITGHGNKKFCDSCGIKRIIASHLKAVYTYRERNPEYVKKIKEAHLRGRVCKFCGKNFTRTVGVYCSDECKKLKTASRKDMYIEVVKSIPADFPFPERVKKILNYLKRGELA